jgi:hypothetical protein
MRRLLIPFALCLALAAPAFAGEAPKKDEKKDNAVHLDFAQVGLPILQGGRLVNYVFVHLRVVLTPGGNLNQVADKDPYLRDALVKEASRSSFMAPGDPNKLDEAMLKRAVMADLARLVGPGAIAQVQVMSQQPKKILPRPQPAPAAEASTQG